MAKTSESLALAKAREVARGVVRERFPELAGVEPHLSKRHAGRPCASDARRLGLSKGVTRHALRPEYTFIFARDVRTPEGYTLPYIARVTVDDHQRVVKAVLSK